MKQINKLRSLTMVTLFILVVLGVLYTSINTSLIPTVHATPAPEYDYVDSQSNVDSVADKGTHSNFTAQKDQLATYDTLSEANVPVITNEATDYVDSIYSNVYGTHSDFTKQQSAPDTVYDTLTEGSDGVGTTNYPITNMNFTTDATGWTYSETDAKGYCYDGGWQSSGGNTGGSGGGCYRVIYNDTASNQPATSVTDIMKITCSFTTPATSLLSKYASFAWKYALDSGSYSTQTLNVSCNLLDASGNTLQTLWSTTTMQTTWQYQRGLTISYALAVSTTYQLGLRFTIVNGGTGNKADIFKISIYWDDAGVKLNTYNYRLDLQEQWTSADYSENTEYLCIKTGTLNSENLGVDVYNGAGWTNVISALTASAWNNVSVHSYLTSSTFIMRFIDVTQTSDPTQTTWQIDAVLLHTYTNTTNYRLEIEEQFTNASYTRTYRELCIKMGTYTGTVETISVQWWNTTSSSWLTIISSLTASQWNNISVTTYLTSSTFTIRFVDGTQTGDANQNTWQKDCALLHTYPIGYKLNLRVQDWDKTDNIASAVVIMNNGSQQIKTSDSNGWANYTGVSGSVTVSVKYFGYFVNYTTLTVSFDTTLNLQCKLYDVTVLVQESVQNATLAGANVTVYNSTSVQGNKITSGLTGNNGQVQLLNLPNNTLTFTQYGGASYSLVIGNTTPPLLVSSENQTITLTADQNSVNTNNNYSIIAFIGMTIPLKGSFATGRLKKKRRAYSKVLEKTANKLP